MKNKEDYIYTAKVIKVYDGDTITVDINLWFWIILQWQKIRLYWINTPEMKWDNKEEWKSVRDYVRSRILRNISMFFFALSWWFCIFAW